MTNWICTDDFDASAMTVDYTVAQGMVIWHLVDQYGTAIHTTIGRVQFLNDCELLYSIDASLLPTSEHRLEA